MKLTFEKTYQMANDHPSAMSWPEYEALILREWHQLLNSDDESSEKRVQQFLEQHPCMVPGADTLLSPSGHYPIPGAVISQPVLPDFTRKVPDFMWIATDSETITPVLIELEAPGKRWFTESGEETPEFRHAHRQLQDWKSWFAQPLNSARFPGYYRIPEQITRLRTLRPLFVLIYGRREEATRSEDLAQRRAHIHCHDEVYMTYDRLRPQYDNRRYMTVCIRQDGYYAKAIPPTVQLGPCLARYWRMIAGKVEALQDSPYLGAERQRFLAERFPYWDSWCEREDGTVYGGDWE